MGLITKPLLAARLEGTDVKDLKYPVAATPKFDGLRCLMIDGKAVSRTFKPIPNRYIRTMLEKFLLDGMDMELVMAGYPQTGTFQETSGNIMREDGKPNFLACVLDWVAPSWGLEHPYFDRIDSVEDWWDRSRHTIPFAVTVVTPKLINNASDLVDYEQEMLAAGFEGIMARDPNGRYKCGRSTVREGILIKIKRFESMEAKVMSVEPLMHNTNEAGVDNFGRTKRSTAKVGMVADELMGKLIVEGINGDYQGITFEVGTGFNAEQRKQFWQNRKQIIGKVITITYFPQGIKDKPRFPVFHGWRDKIDLD